jgi:WD40 repeat protein
MRIQDVTFFTKFSFRCVSVAVLLSIASILSLAAQAAEKAKPIPIAPLSRSTPVDFQDEILPILRTSCLACHNRTTTKSGLILETPQTILKGSEDGPVVVPGKSAESQLLDLAAHLDKPVMPPRDNKASAPNLTSEQLALVKLWIDQGAKGEVRSTAIHWQSIARTFTPAYAAAITPDAQFAAVGRANQLDLYQLPFQRPLPPLIDPALAKMGPIAHRDMVYALAFSPDGQRLASGSFGEIKIWRRLATTARIMFTSGTAGVVAASPDGKWLALAGDKNDVRIVDAATGKFTTTLAGNSAPARVVRFSPDSSRLATASARTLRIWNLSDSKPSPELASPAEIRSMTWSNTGKQLVAGFADNIIRVYKVSEVSAAALTAGAELKGHTAAVTALDSITPGNQLLSGSTDGTVRIWNLDNGQPVRQMSQGGPVTSVAARADGKSLASAGEDGITKIWDAAKGTLIAEVKGDRELNLIAAEKDDTAKLAAADTAYFKTVLAKAQADLKAQEERGKKAAEAKVAADKPVPAKEAALKSATDAKAQADQLLATATADQKRSADAAASADQAQKDAETAFAKVKSQKPSPDTEALKTKLSAATKTAADAKAALVKADAALKQITAGAAKAGKALASADDALKAAQRVQANAANEVTLASAAVTRANTAIATEESTINAAEQREKQCAAQSATAKQAAASAQKPIRAVAFSPDGSTIATAGDDQKIHLWSESGAPLQTIDAHAAPVVALSFSSTNRLLSASADGAANLWNIAPVWTLERTIGSGDANSTLSDRVNALAFSPDGQALASGSGEPSRGGEIKLWEIATGNLLREFKNTHSDAVLCLDFSRDGKRLASGAADRFAKITDLTTGKVIQSLEGHTHHVLAVSFKADGRTLASTGADGQIKMWDLVAGERKAAVPGTATEVTSIHFAGITNQAILTSADHQVRVITETGGAVRTFTGPADHIHAAALSGDGKTLLCSGQSGALYLWDAAAGKLIATFAPHKD